MISSLRGTHSTVVSFYFLSIENKTLCLQVRQTKYYSVNNTIVDN